MNQLDLVKKCLELAKDKVEILELEDPDFRSTPVLWAAYYGHTEIEDYLKTNGANLLKKNGSGLSIDELRLLGIVTRSNPVRALDDAELIKNINKCGIPPADRALLKTRVERIRVVIKSPVGKDITPLTEFAGMKMTETELLKVQSVIDTSHDITGIKVNISKPSKNPDDKISYSTYKPSDILHKSSVPFKNGRLFFSPKVTACLPGAPIEDKDFFLIGLAKHLNFGVCSGEIHSKMQVKALQLFNKTPKQTPNQILKAFPGGHIFEFRSDTIKDFTKLLKILSEAHGIPRNGGRFIAAVDEAKSSLDFSVAKNSATLADPGKKSPEGYGTTVAEGFDETGIGECDELAGGKFRIVGGYPNVKIEYTSPFTKTYDPLVLDYKDPLLGTGPGLSIHELSIILTCLFSGADVETILTNNGRLNAGRIQWGLQLIEKLLINLGNRASDRSDAIIALITFLKAVGDLLSVKFAELTGSALITGDRLTFANAVKHKVKVAAFTHGSSPRVLLWSNPIADGDKKEIISDKSRERQLKGFLQSIYKPSKDELPSPYKKVKPTDMMGGAILPSKSINDIIDSIINLLILYSNENAGYILDNFDSVNAGVVRYIFPLNTFVIDEDAEDEVSLPSGEIRDEYGNYIDNPNIRVPAIRIFTLVSDVVDRIYNKTDDETIREEIRLFFEYNGYYRGEPIVAIIEDILVNGAEVPSIDGISETAIKYIETENAKWKQVASLNPKAVKTATPSLTYTLPTTAVHSEESMNAPLISAYGGASSKTTRRQKKKLRTQKRRRVTTEIVPYQP